MQHYGLYTKKNLRFNELYFVKVSSRSALYSWWWLGLTVELMQLQFFALMSWLMCPPPPPSLLSTITSGLCAYTTLLGGERNCTSNRRSLGKRINLEIPNSFCFFSQAVLGPIIGLLKFYHTCRSQVNCSI